MHFDCVLTVFCMDSHHVLSLYMTLHIHLLVDPLSAYISTLSLRHILKPINSLYAVCPCDCGQAQPVYLRSLTMSEPIGECG